MGKINPVWLHPGTPESLAYYEAKAREEIARFELECTTVTMAFEVAGEDRIVVEEAINKAMEITGTSLPGIAFEHICTAYVQNGPLARAMNRMDARAKAKKIGLVELMKQVGPDEVMETFNALFPQSVDAYGGVNEKD